MRQDGKSSRRKERREGGRKEYKGKIETQPLLRFRPPLANYHRGWHCRSPLSYLQKTATHHINRNFRSSPKSSSLQQTYHSTNLVLLIICPFTLANPGIGATKRATVCENLNINSEELNKMENLVISSFLLPSLPSVLPSFLPSVLLSYSPSFLPSFL